MGFGLLLFGYFVAFAFSISEYYFFADIIGAVIMILAFLKLDTYNRYFRRAIAATACFAVFCGVNALSLAIDIYPPDGTADMMVDLSKLLTACLTHVFAFMGTHGISMNASSDKLVKATDRSFSMTMVYYAFAVAVIALSDRLGAFVQYASAVVYLYWLVCIAVNLVLFYKCFAILAPADEDENEIKPSRFAIVNKINDKFDEMEKNTQAYRLESAKMALEEADRRAAERAKKKNNGKNKKSKKKK